MFAASAAKGRPLVMPPVSCRVTIGFIFLDGMEPYVFQSKRASDGFMVAVTRWNVYVSNGPSEFLGGEVTSLRCGSK